MLPGTRGADPAWSSPQAGGGRAPTACGEFVGFSAPPPAGQAWSLRALCRPAPSSACPHLTPPSSRHPTSSSSHLLSSSINSCQAPATRQALCPLWGHTVRSKCTCPSGTLRPPPFLPPEPRAVKPAPRGLGGMSRGCGGVCPKCGRRGRRPLVWPKPHVRQPGFPASRTPGPWHLEVFVIDLF